MRLLIVRHAHAGDPEAFAETGKPDQERPLSRKGRKQIRAAVKGLRVLVPRVSLIATSPYVRAAETAEIIARRYKKAEREEVNALKPAAALDSFLTWAARHKLTDDVIVVGHEPHLGKLVSMLVTGTAGSAIPLRKGGAALIEFEEAPAEGRGQLLWFMGPDELAAMIS